MVKMGHRIFFVPGKKAGNAKRDAGESNRVIAGNSDNGGAANTNWNHPGNSNDNVGFRLAVVCLLKKGNNVTCSFVFRAGHIVTWKL